MKFGFFSPDLNQNSILKLPSRREAKIYVYCFSTKKKIIFALIAFNFVQTGYYFKMWCNKFIVLSKVQTSTVEP